MTTLSEIMTSVEETLDDDSVGPSLILKRINEGLLHCSRKVRLPELESAGSFDTVVDGNAVDIPVGWNYQRGLYSAAYSEGSPIVVASSIGIIKDKYPELDNEIKEGEIEFVTTRNGQLIYFPVPTVVRTVFCKFYINPTPLAKSKDVPSCLPDHLQAPLLESYALWKIYAKIEDGNEGVKVNTNYYKKEFKEIFEDLDDDIDEGQSAPDPVRENGWI